MELDSGQSAGACAENAAAQSGEGAVRDGSGERGYCESTVSGYGRACHGGRAYTWRYRDCIFPVCVWADENLRCGVFCADSVGTRQGDAGTVDVF